MGYKEELGIRIRDRREELGMTQAELAKKLGYTNRSMVSLVESGKRSLDVDQLRPLAKALELSIDDLLDGPTSIDDQLTETLSRMTDDQKEAALRFLQSMFAER